MSSNDPMEKLLAKLRTIVNPKEDDSKYVDNIPSLKSALVSIDRLKDAWDSSKNIDIQGLTLAEKSKKYGVLRANGTNTMRQEVRAIKALIKQHPDKKRIRELLDLIYIQFAERPWPSFHTKESKHISEEAMPKKRPPKP